MPRPKGLKHTEETRRQMSLSRKGRIVSDETREKLRLSLREAWKNSTGRFAYFKEHPTQKGLKRSPETIERLRAVHKGKRTGAENNRWNGGKMAWCKQQVRIRDDYTCQTCGLRDEEIIEVDHVIPKSKAPELTYSLDNLVALCPNCHARKTIRELKSR